MKKAVIWVLAVFLAAGGVFAQGTDFGSLRAKYGAVKGRIEADCDKQKTEKLVAYGNLLGSIMAQLKQKGVLDAYLAVEREKKRFDTEKSIPEKPDGEYVVKAVDAYRATVAKLDSEKAAKVMALQKAYVAQLEPLIKSLMQADKIDDAKRVKEEMDRVSFELAEVEVTTSKTTEAEEKLPDSSRPGILLSAGKKKVVLWNMHNGPHNNSGTLSCDVILYADSKSVWEAKGVDVPWKPGVDSSVTKVIPAGIKFDKVRVEITKWQGVAGGLSEIQVFDGSKNVAEYCKATASGHFSESYLPERVTDGETSSETYGKGYWHLPLGQSGWIDVDLTKKVNGKDKK